MLYNNKKDIEGTKVKVLGIEIDTNNIIARLVDDKVTRIIEELQEVLYKGNITLETACILASYLL